MKRILIFLIFTQFTLVQYGQIIADHTAVDKYDDIPQYYINEVKKMLLVVAGESHSLGYMRGLVAMESSFPAYDVNYTDTPEAYTTSHLRISRTTWGDVNNITGWINSYGEEDWYTSTTAINRTKAGISYYNTQGIPMSAFGFGHCYGDGGTDYITATQSYIDYCTTNGISTKVYFTTGAVDTYDAGYDKYLMHKQIRDYVNLNSDRILFDYADILCYDDGNPVEYTITDNGHTIQAITPKNNYPDGPSHISSAGELRLAKAMWWMLARIAGWNGNVTTIPVTSITISGGTAITTDGGTLQLSSSVLPANATNKTITWSISSGTDKASISATGLVTALDNGTATAKATAADGSGVFGTATITISNQVIPVSSITISGGTAIATDGGTLQLTASVLPANATNKTVTWSITSGSAYAIINSSTGLLTAVANGTVTVRATANDGSNVSGSMVVTITNQTIPAIPVTSISVTGTGGATTISTGGGTLQLIATVLPANATNKTVTWSITSGSAYATINSLTGLLTAVDNGAVNVRATAADGSGVFGTATITISNQVIPVSSITISGGTAITTDGGTLQLSSSVLPANATNKTITWSISSGTDKASISATGLVTALDNGTATAKATAADGSGVFGTATIIISNQVNISIVNEPPVIVVNYQSSSYSGFVSEIDASGSYDVNKDNLTYSWIVPNNVPVSSTTGSILKYLGPVVSSSQTIEFTLSVNDGKTIQSKVFSIEIFPYKPELEVAEISDIKASSFQPPYYAYNIIDGNIGTMWAANGDNQWLIVGLKHSFKVQHIKLAFLQGQKRESYFDILGSKDSINWEPILIKSASCFFSGDLQVFEFPPSKSEKEFNYIKLIGLGNSADTWNYISELKIFGYKHRNTPNYDKLAVKVYPNPAKKYVTFRIDEQLLAPDHIQLLNLSGTVVFNRELDPYLKEFTVPLDLKNGIYIVTLESDNIILFTQKLIVSN